MNYYLVYLAQLKYVLIKWYNDSRYHLNNVYMPNELIIYLFAMYGFFSFLNQFRTKKMSIELNLNDSMNEIRLRKRRRICYVDLDKKE